MNNTTSISTDNEANLKNRHRIGKVFKAFLIFSMLIGLIMLVVLIVDIAVEGGGWVRPQLFQNYHSRKPEKAGMKSAIVGSLIVISMTGLFCFPLGIGAAIYLEEYAPHNWLTRFINININNLAGVPSIVFGMLGLVVFGRMFGAFSPDSWLVTTFNLPINSGAVGGMTFNLFNLEALEMHLPFGRSMVAGALTMSLLILPVVIISAREAIRAIPNSLRLGSYALGATRWQVIASNVLPNAMTGIMTGVILSISRAMGETAPLIIMGAFTYVPFLPESVWDQFTVMPIQIYNWITLPQENYRVHLAAAGILVMLAVLLSLNALAVFLRNKYQKKW